MTRIIESRRKLSARLEAKQDVSDSIPALMGDGNGNIDVDVVNQPGQVFIRVGDGDLGQAFNNRVPRADNLAIDVGYDPITDPQRRIFQVLNVRMADYAGAGNTPFPNVGPHHETHEYGGGDDTYISWRRLMGFRVGRPAGFVVTIDQGNIIRAGAWLAVLSQTIDLTASKPALSTQARYVLITLDSAGVASSTDGALVAVGALDISDCPVPADGEIPLAAVRLYGTQSSIGDVPTAPDIIDLRFPQASSTGTVFLSSLEPGTAQYQVITTGPNPFPAIWSGFYVRGTAGGTTNLDVLAGATLTLYAAVDSQMDITGKHSIGGGGATSFLNMPNAGVTITATAAANVGLIFTGSSVLTIPATGTAVLGTGAADTLAKWSGTNVLTNIANAAGYLYNNGGGAFSYVAAPLPGVHNVLDSTYHGDVLTGAITRGDLLYGNATPKIARLALGGAAGSFLTRDANDVVWSGFYLAGTALQTYTFPAVGGTVALLNAGNVFTTNQAVTLSTNGDVYASVTNVNAGASASASLAVVSDTVTAYYRVFSAAAAGGARLNLTSTGGYMLMGTTTNHLMYLVTNNLVRMTIAAAGGVTIAGAFGCNAAAAQTAYASGGALAAYAGGTNGLDTAAHMQALYNLVVAIRAALVADGIMS